MALRFAARCCKAALLSFLLAIGLFASAQDKGRSLDLPDSVKAIALVADVNVRSYNGRKEAYAGIAASSVQLLLEAEKNEREVKFIFPGNARIIAKGVGVEADDNELEWEYSWQLNTTYKLLIASAADSAANFVLYSGYVLIPGENKWKLLGTCKVEGQWTSLKSPATVLESTAKGRLDAMVGNAWVQRSAGSWKPLDPTLPAIVPSINPMPALDSVQQYQMERRLLADAILAGKTDVRADTMGIYYKIIDPGTGKTVNVTDTVTVKYQLRIFGTSEIIDQATDKPATFPLNRLIKAWQITVPMVKTGGKLKIVIPSAFAYSIRTRAPKIPPNSVLEFDIEVLDTRPAG